MQQKPVGARGFTIIELLIVIVVIGILAAISIVAYNGISQKANEVSITTQLSDARKLMEIYRVEHGEWQFQAAMDNPSAPEPKWCHAAMDWIISKYDLDYDGYRCTSGFSGRYVCLGIDTKDVHRSIYISRDGPNVSPVLSEGNSWCVKQQS